MLFDCELQKRIVLHGLSEQQIKDIQSNMNGIKRMTFGYCPVCEKETIFLAREYGLRDHYRCIRCGCIPRNRAIIKILQSLRPNWRTLTIHESSPTHGYISEKFKSECDNYTFSYYDEKNELGEMYKNDKRYSNQNLEEMTFENNSFDVFITSDVFEHILNPWKAFNEINRVLRHNGIHIFTTPLYPFIRTRSRIRITDKEVVNVLPPIYHGNPISQKGSLVTYDWGGDIVEKIYKNSGMKSEIYQFQCTEENYKMGLEGDFLFVIVSWKSR